MDMKSFLFLEHKEYVRSIARIAVVFQSVVTLSIGLELVLSATSPLQTSELLIYTMILDTVFVSVHLFYRLMYRGPKVILSSSSRNMLILHAGTSSCALVSTWMSMYFDRITQQAVVLLVVWGVSLFSGIIFYRKKYN